jgi:hypothetical protein
VTTNHCHETFITIKPLGRFRMSLTRSVMRVPAFVESLRRNLTMAAGVGWSWHSALVGDMAASCLNLSLGKKECVSFIFINGRVGADGRISTVGKVPVDADNDIWGSIVTIAVRSLILGSHKPCISHFRIATPTSAAKTFGAACTKVLRSTITGRSTNHRWLFRLVSHFCTILAHGRWMIIQCRKWGRCNSRPWVSRLSGGGLRETRDRGENVF